jgi:ribosomal protein S18 acetylase RimI-like enzyme
MSQSIQFDLNRVGAEKIAAHLRASNTGFVPSLSNRVNIDEYARKIADKAQHFNAWLNNRLIGFMATYCNQTTSQSLKDAAFITSVSVLPDWQGRGIASRLMKDCITHVYNLGFVRIKLQVDNRNSVAKALYERFGFYITAMDAHSEIMVLDIVKNAAINESRLTIRTF